VILGVKECEVVHFGAIQRLACRAVSASAELHELFSFITDYFDDLHSPSNGCNKKRNEQKNNSTRIN